MAKYFTVKSKTVRNYDDDWDFGYDRVGVITPTVNDHVATDTGLLDLNGDQIMRAPNPIGFIWDDELK